MEVNINNFRSVREYRCFFDNETTLLKGPSGKGKTTIFEAIKWCLYGGNKNVFPLLGKKETMVFVKYNNISIKRIKPSNLLEVKTDQTELTGDEAQEYINQIFGSKSLWLSYSYLSQNEDHLLLAGSQNDKIELVKELIYGKEKENTDKYYENIKNSTKKLNKELDQITGSLNSLDFILEREEKTVDLEIIKLAKKNKKLISQKDFLLEKKDTLTEELISHDKQTFINQQLTNYQNKIIKLKKELSKYPPNLKYNSLKSWDTYLKASKNYIPELEEETEDLETILSQRGLAIQRKEILKKYSIEKKDLLNEIKILEQLKDKYYAYQEYLKIKKIYDGQEKEINQIQNYIQTLKSMEIKVIKLWNIIIQHLKLDLEYTLDNYTKVKELLNQLDNISMECPYCNKNLLYKDNTLIKNQYDLDKSCLDDLVKKLDKVKTFFDNLNKASNKLENLELNKISLPVISEEETCNQDIKELEKKLSELLTIETCLYDLEDIDTKIKKIKVYQHNKNLKEQIDTNYQSWYQDFEYPEDACEYFKNYESIQYEYNKSNDFIKENTYLEIKPKEKIEELLSKIKLSLEKIDQYTKALELDQKIKEIKKEIKSKDNRRKEISKELNALVKIEKIIKKSEIEFLEKAIDNLNFYLNQYLSRMFEDIYIEISMFKKTKEEIKPNINMILKINGIEYENLSYLSGGEKNRISLALTISLNKIQDGSVLLLDEVMSSLDSYNRQECLKILKKEGRNKVILNICHETIEGYYDKIIEF